MRLFAPVCAAVLAAVLFALPAAGGERLDPQTARQLESLEGAIDELNRESADTRPETRSRRGETLNQAFVALTGEAINPLFGVTALGMYSYFRTDPAVRHLLPIYDQPEVWIPLLVIILLMLFNSTICEALPFLKVPLNALGDIVNKAGAVAVLPLVVKMFADAAASPAGNGMSRIAAVVFPAAYAAEGGAAGAVWPAVGWLAGAIVGVAVYLAVWLTFNVVDVLILICPFPGVDALLKSARLAVLGLLAGSYHLSPSFALGLAIVLAVVSFFVAGWSFRLSVFGWLFSTDILFFRRRGVTDGPVSAFVTDGLCRSRNLPIRTLGRLETGANGELVFSYRPWLVLGRRSVVLGRTADFSAGRGLLSPFVVSGDSSSDAWLRLPPRYRGREDELAEHFGLRGVVDCGVAGSLRAWFSGQVGRKCPETA